MTTASPSIEYLTLQSDAVSDNQRLVPCAARIVAPADVDRVSTHFILLLDISESMMDAQKLANCKKCAVLLLNFMTDADRLSLITFGEEATLHLKRVPADDAHKTASKQCIEALQCKGCTNLSAGLGYVREVCEGDTQKAGLLILTDGHANRGVSDPAGLRSIIGSLRESFSHLSVHSVAYGVDHNADLLRGIAEDSQGSYNVVNSIEDTAFAFGETLGGLMSCAYQNVKIQVPAGSVVHGPHKIVQEGEKHVISIGDVYAGTKPLVLFDIPVTEVSTVDAVQVRGMSLPSLQSWCITPVQQMLLERDRDIELTKLRYTCTGILKDIRDWRTLTAEQKDGLDGRIDTFATAVNSDFFNGHPVATLLRTEVETLREMLALARRGPISNETSVFANQHLTSIALGRGFTTPMAPSASSRAAPLRRQNANVRFDPQDPTVITGETTLAAAAEDPDTSATVFMSPAQQRVATLMRTSSQQPY
jgi:Mg-chelatase subunit ChlD